MHELVIFLEAINAFIQWHHLNLGIYKLFFFSYFKGDGHGQLLIIFIFFIRFLFIFFRRLIWAT